MSVENTDADGDSSFACVCGDTFDTKLGLGTHMGQHCEQASTTVEKTCNECGETFEISKSKVSNGEGKYCSNECQRNRVTKTCNECGDTFELPESDVANGRGKFCSRECYYSSQKCRVTKTCNECGDTFEIAKYKVENGGGEFCSRECYGKSRKLPEELRDGGSYGSIWQDRRLEALARDSWKCQECGIGQSECREEHTTGLHVHHKTPYREFESDEEAHQLDNLVTLCPPCHRERHK